MGDALQRQLVGKEPTPLAFLPPPPAPCTHFKEPQAQTWGFTP